jgi:hypothetical protein
MGTMVTATRDDTNVTMLYFIDLHDYLFLKGANLIRRACDETIPGALSRLSEGEVTRSSMLIPSDRDPCSPYRVPEMEKSTSKS